VKEKIQEQRTHIYSVNARNWDISKNLECKLDGRPRIGVLNKHVPPSPSRAYAENITKSCVRYISYIFKDRSKGPIYFVGARSTIALIRQHITTSRSLSWGVSSLTRHLTDHRMKKLINASASHKFRRYYESRNIQTHGRETFSSS
jgi:hypothetical protein